MKSEAWIFGICTTFFVLVSPAYWFITSKGEFAQVALRFNVLQ